MVKKGKSRKKVKNEARKLDKLAWTLANVIAQNGKRKVRDNFWHYCPTCQMAYCHDFTGSEMFCHECFFKGCIKEQGKTDVCEHCGNTRAYA
jgi:acetyl-CoA carboxylase beta subunit